MTTQRTHISTLLSKVCDLLLLGGALGCTLLLLVAPSAETGGLLGFFSARIKVTNALLGGTLVLGWYFALLSQGLYQAGLRRVTRWKRIAQAVVVAALVLFLIARIGAWPTINARTTTAFAAISFALLVSVRLLKALFQTKARCSSLLIVGGGRRGQRLAEQIVAHPERGYRLLGYVESDPAYNYYELAEKPCLGTLDDLPRLVANQVVDEVVIALPIKSQYAQIERAVTILEEQGITTHVLSDLFPVHFAKSQPLEFQGTPLLSLQSAPAFDWRAEIKRVFDFVVASATLLCLLPLLTLVALAIKLTSPGPVLFVQQRMGWHKRPFRLFKFRTMVVDAEARMKEIEHLNEKEGPIFKIKNDPRITPLGRFLRKTSIDELPQLLNVVLGDMSLVGPRPLSMRDALGMSEAWQKRRFSVKPGITGLWQVSGRSELSFEQWMQLDLEYIDRWSLSLDFRILLRTIPAVLTGHGAA
ncbi:MAG: sugar transferase [Blastocatellia bacterium]|nr:sugar transferase [Blastocatellia bacterium]